MLKKLVELLNSYKNFIEIDLIFCSEEDFLYRQKGQLKLDNSITEEFLPYLINPILLPELKNQEFMVGPTPSFSAAYFSSSLDVPKVGGGFSIRTKNQDFAISKRVYLKASHSPEFKSGESVTADAFISYVAVECKTNLDKTMFQEGCATAHDIKSAVSGAKYFIMIEWLDMAPLSTAGTDIDEVILLRKAKRLNSNVRQFYSKCNHRTARLDEYTQHMLRNPLRVESFERFLLHIKKLFAHESLVEEDVLTRGYF